MIGLKIMLQDSHFVGIMMSDAEANKIIKEWTGGHYEKHSIRCLAGRCSKTGVEWTVLTSAILGMHTFQDDSTPKQPAAGWPGNFIGKSGVN